MERNGADGVMELLGQAPEEADNVRGTVVAV